MNQQALYFGQSEEKLFGWYHQKNESNKKDCAIVICAPFGYEFTHGHRTLRHLAKKLAEQGIPTLRFDYHGVGNSPGIDLDSDRPKRWKQDIRSAIEFLRQTSGCKKIGLIGLRLGASLAAEISSEQELNYLVLWNPVISGKRYVREMQAIAMTSQDNKNNLSTGIDVAGFMITNDTAETLKKINLLELKFKVTDRILLVQRDDLQLDQSLLLKLKDDQVPAEEILTSGYLEMMAEPQFSKVPELTLNQITDWLVKHTETDLEQNRVSLTKFDSSINLEESENKKLFEEAHYFGKKNDLFGVLSYLDIPKNDKPMIVFLNSGSVHHVGPHRLYVSLARDLAKDGFNCFRMDLHGLGESGLLAGTQENNPYPELAVSDTEEALGFLKNHFGINRFILMGLCSGAHTAFHSGIEVSNEFNIVDTVLINPLTFRWVEGMSLETTSNSTARNFQDVAYYKSTMRDPKKWLKLFKGNVQFRQIGKIFINRLKKLIDSFFDFSTTTELSKDLEKLFLKCPTLTLFVSQTDPGFDLLLNGAKKLVKKEIKAKRIRVSFIQDADHTFSAAKSRIELSKQLRKRFN